MMALSNVPLQPGAQLLSKVGLPQGDTRGNTLLAQALYLHASVASVRLSWHALHGRAVQAHLDRESPVRSPVAELQQQPGLQHLWAV